MFKTLIVEDEAVIRKGLIMTFDWLKFGCMIIGEARDGVEGLDKIREHQPDLVIADIAMPGMNGLEMIEKGLQYCQFESILLTGYSEFEYAKKAVELHSFAYLTKPIDRDELIRTLLSLSEKKDRSSEQKPFFPVPEGFDVIAGKDLNYYVRSVIEIIKERYDKRLQLETIAQELFVSKSYLSRKLQEDTAHTFTELLYQYRLQKAISLLNDGKYRVSEVAALTGFHDYKHFNEVFKKHLHMSPSEYISHPEMVVFKTDE